MTLAEWFRRVWRIPVWLRYHLLQRRRLRSTRMQRVLDCNLVLTPEVFDPLAFQTGRFLGEVVRDWEMSPHDQVLDLGAGSGILALAAAAKSRHVTAVDINPIAVQCARTNARLNRLDKRVEVLQGDLFEPVKGRRFDLILFNPPYLTGAPKDVQDRAFRDPEMPRRFAAGLGEHLSPGGRALLVLSSIGRRQDFITALQQQNWQTSKVAERDLWSEVLQVVQVSR